MGVGGRVGGMAGRASAAVSARMAAGRGMPGRAGMVAGWRRATVTALALLATAPWAMPLDAQDARRRWERMSITGNRFR